jgi:hypothetical protein
VKETPIDYNAIAEFARQFLPNESAKNVEIRQGVVVDSDDDGNYTIILAGASHPVSGIRSISAEWVESDRSVWLLKIGPDLIILGQMAQEYSAIRPVGGFYRTSSGHAVNEIVLEGKFDAAGADSVPHFLQGNANLRVVCSGACFSGNSEEAVSGASLETRVDGTTFYVNGGTSEAYNKGWRGFIRYTRGEYPWVTT